MIACSPSSKTITVESRNDDDTSIDINMSIYNTNANMKYTMNLSGSSVYLP